MRILIVDDDFAIRKILTVWLEPHANCDTMVNGREAVEAVKSAITEEQPYDLICLDIMMPEMSGIDALKEIREYEDGVGIRIGDGAQVVMLTAAANPSSIMGAFKEQCEAYLVKPVEKEELFNAIEKVGFKLG